MNQERRTFMGRAAVLCAGTALGAYTHRARALSGAARELAFVHLHTGERLELIYAADGRYMPEALASVNHFLRDHYSGEIGLIDPRLLDQLYEIRLSLGGDARFLVISGYRCPATNAALRRRSAGVASNSLHMQGRAIDMRLEGVPLPELRDAALELKAGGVGFYPASNFVHVDTGRVRRW